MNICDRTFELAKTHLATLDYHGPVALACDDTKLFATLRLFWDKKKMCYFLIGACDGPIQVLNVDAAREVLTNPDVKKATKVHYIQFVYRYDNKTICLDPLMVHDNSCGRSRANPPRCSPNLRLRDFCNTSATPQENSARLDQREDPDRLLFLRWYGA